MTLTSKVRTCALPAASAAAACGRDAPAEAPVRAIVADLVAAWNAGDGQACARHLAPDASFTNVFGMATYGAPAFAKRHAEILATFYKATTKHHTIRRIRFVTADVAIDDIDNEVRGVKALPGRNRRPARRRPEDAAYGGFRAARGAGEACDVAAQRRGRASGIITRSWEGDAMFLNRTITIGLLLAASMSADVTLRYKTTFKLNPSLPAQMAEQAMKGMGDAIPLESVYQLKEGKGASSMGRFRAIVDFTTQRITIVDPGQKRMATTTSSELVDELSKSLANMPAAAREAMAAMKANADSKLTGRTTTVQGIETEEREVTMTVEGPPVPNMPPGPMFKLSIHFWTAKADEVLRVPALREFAGHNMWGYATMNPAGSFDKMLQQMPGMGEAFGKVMKDMQAAKAMLLRSEFQMWMPAIAAMMKQMPADQNPFGAGFDADAPFLEMSQDLTELSSAPVSASVFAVPEGYQEAPIGEMVRDMMPKTAGAK